MYNNHIIIGLGGTGGKVIRAFRKILWEDCRNLEARFKNEQTGVWGEPAANIAYLYADSNQDDLDGKDGSWEVLGQSLKLDESEKVLLSDESGGVALMNKRQFPGVSGWIGDTEILKPMIRDATALHGCNQIRRFGRYVFAQNAGRFMEKIRTAEGKLIQASKRDGRTFHVCCTLGCGTGSGSIVDAVCQIRKEHHTPEQVKANPIFLYCLINSEMGEKANAGFFYPNQFAVLSELNALSICLWHPHDVAPRNNVEQRLPDEIKDYFETCYLISPKTDDLQYADKPGQEEMIAAYVYQKIVSLRESLPEELQKAETCEDFKSNRCDDRCSRFASLGIKRYRIPEEEIREKLSFTFCRQAALQSLNNHLRGGYLETQRDFDENEFAISPENQERWCLTDAHLMLSTDFSPTGGKKWPSIADDWTLALNRQMGSLIKFKNKTKEDRQTWLPEMRKFADAYFSRSFRDSGVNIFYQNKRDQLSECARSIRQRIEIHLFEKWRLGDHSVIETDKILEEIINNLTKRQKVFDERISENRKAEESSDTKLRSAEENWRKLGVGHELLNVIGIGSKPEKILSGFTTALADKHIAHTEVVACDFARDLVQQIVDQLGESRRRLAEVIKLFADLQKQFQEQVVKRITDNRQTDLTTMRELRLVNKPEIDKTIEALRTDDGIQKLQCAGVREAIASFLGNELERRTFTSFAQHVRPIELDKLIYATCDKAADTYHTTYFNKQRDVKQILGLNIVDKLNDKVQGDIKKLTSEIQSLVRSASTYVQLKERVVDEVHPELAVPQPHAVAAQPPRETGQEQRLGETERNKHTVCQALRQTICNEQFSHRGCCATAPLPN